MFVASTNGGRHSWPIELSGTAPEKLCVDGFSAQSDGLKACR